MKVRKSAQKIADRMVHNLLQWDRTDEGAEMSRRMAGIGPLRRGFNGTAPIMVRNHTDVWNVCLVVDLLQWDRTDEGAEITFSCGGGSTMG